MSVEKTFKGVRLSDEELLVIQNIQEKYGLSNFSQTISYLIREYPHLQVRMKSCGKKIESK